METSYAEIVRFLEGCAELQHGAGASGGEIEELEQAWGAKLPGDFARFLREWGYVSFDSTEIPGVGSDVPDFLDIRFLAASLWDGPARLPGELLPIYDSAGGWWYCLLRGEAIHVVLWVIGSGKKYESDEMYKSWTEWFCKYFIA